MKFDNSYARLPDGFFARLAPTPVAAPRLIGLNRELAALLGLDGASLEAPEGVEMLAGNRLPTGAEPLAMVYAGHQFGGFVPQLGDGRAILLGEVIGTDGVRRDIQLKGAGPTPFSRRGDGRAAIGPVLREYIVSEAMTALGIPATRALAAVLTGEQVMRETVLPGAVLARVATSHVRFGTFQYFAARRNTAALRTLADYVIARHYPDAAARPNPYRALIEAVAARQAELVARWLGVGFIHGVMNTDNMSIAGETIDFGPCAFMDTFHPDKVFSSIDRGGRYAYANQPGIAHWNLMCLAQALLPLLGEADDQALDEAQAAIDVYPGLFGQAWLKVMTEKIGIGRPRDTDGELVQDLLSAMSEGRADFTLTFRRLSKLDLTGEGGDDAVRELFDEPGRFDAWAVRWRQRLARDEGSPQDIQRIMLAANPAMIARNHRVEEVIQAAHAGEYGPFDRMLSALAEPYEDRPQFADYCDPPREDQVVCQTFCGT